MSNSTNRQIAIKDIIEWLETFPAADIVEVVRCKNCKYGEQDENGWWYCHDLGCQMGDIDGNGFCSDAERREE